jgi:peptidoglycan/xylan/chitin deacetylase (PgdA/CDA1 family)
MWYVATLRGGMNELIASVWRTSTRPVGSVRSVRTGEPVIVLTFDDGPSPGSTEGLLDALAAFGASATFFVVMTRVRRSPHLLAAIVDAGHEVALHGPDHVRLTRLPFRDVVERSRAAKLELEDLAGRPVRWVRPPYGAQTLRSWAAVRRAGLTPVMWGGTTWDWKDEPMERRMTKVMSALAPGQIVLAHDAIAGVEDGADPTEAFDLDRGAFVKTLLGVYQEHGIRAVSLGAALAGGASLQRWAWFGP